MDGAQLEYLGTKLNRIIEILAAFEARDLAGRALENMRRELDAKRLIEKRPS